MQTREYLPYSKSLQRDPIRGRCHVFQTMILSQLDQRGAPAQRQPICSLTGWWGSSGGGSCLTGAWGDLIWQSDSTFGIRISNKERWSFVAERTSWGHSCFSVLLLSLSPFLWYSCLGREIGMTCSVLLPISACRLWVHPLCHCLESLPPLWGHLPPHSSF